MTSEFWAVMDDEVWSDGFLLRFLGGFTQVGQWRGYTCEIVGLILYGSN